MAIKHFDKGTASGKHYSSDAPKLNGRVIGGDGVCLLEDGTRVYGIGISGMLAEKAIIHKNRIVKLPDHLSDSSAAALANGVIGSAMGLRFKADIQPGDVVLINGATGFYRAYCRTDCETLRRKNGHRDRKERTIIKGIIITWR